MTVFPPFTGPASRDTFPPLAFTASTVLYAYEKKQESWPLWTEHVIQIGATEMLECAVEGCYNEVIRFLGGGVVWGIDDKVWGSCFHVVWKWRNGRWGTYILYRNPKVSEPRAYVVAVRAVVCSQD